MKNLLLLILLIIFCQCSKQTIDTRILDAKIKHGTEINSDSIFSSVEYIPLETVKNSLIQEINKLVITDSLFYILDRNQKNILSFDKKGKYKKKLNRQGKGPGEYNNILDFCIHNDTLYICDFSRIFIYDLAFNPISDFGINSTTTKILIKDDFLYSYTGFSSSTQKQFHLYNRFTGEYIDSYIPFSEGQTGASYFHTIFAPYKDSIYFFLPYDYSIYHLDKKGEKIYDIKFEEKFRLPEEYKYWNLGKQMEYHKPFYEDPYNTPILSINNLYIGNKLLYFSFSQGSLYCGFFYNKKINKTMVGTLTNSQMFPFIRDCAPLYTDDKLYVTSFSSRDIIIQRKKNVSPQLANLDMEDNPVICIYTFKEDL